MGSIKSIKNRIRSEILQSLSLKILFKDNVVFLGASSVLLYEEGLQISLEGFVSLPFWETWSVFLGFAYSYSAENRSLILSRGFDFVANVMWNLLKTVVIRGNHFV